MSDDDVDGVDEVDGPSAVIEFEAKRCIHSRNCVLARPDVFVPNAPGAWIHPEVATADEIAELAHQCPSGAIRYRRKDGRPGEAAPLVNVVTIRQNGPLAVHAAMTIVGCGEHLRATLCRCGKSQNKPFCDNAHVDAMFDATGEPATQESKPLAARGGVLTITPAEDGPLLIAGNVEIVSGTGRTIDRRTKTALCRCGGSRNKPFCDGTHASNGFMAPGQ